MKDTQSCYLIGQNCLVFLKSKNVKKEEEKNSKTNQKYRTFQGGFLMNIV